MPSYKTILKVKTKQIDKRSGRIHYFHRAHNAPCLPPPPPPKKKKIKKIYITIVSILSWVLESWEEKSNTMVMKNCGVKQGAFWSWSVHK